MQGDFRKWVFFEVVLIKFHDKSVKKLIFIYLNQEKECMVRRGMQRQEGDR